MRTHALVVTVGVLVITNVASAASPNFVAGKLITFNDNAGWCWFEGERAIIHNNKLYIGTVANGAGPGGMTRHGNIEVTTYDLTNNQSSTFILHEKLENDDHDSPALYVRRDGRLLAVYGQHNTTPLQRWRITANPNDTTQWQSEQTLNVGGGYTYSNVYRLSGENNRLYNFHRGVNFNPNYCISDDDGSTWSYGGHTLFWKPDANTNTKVGGAGRPYVRYASNNTDTVHLICTEDHPRNYDNSIYHAYIKAGKIHRSDGSVISDLSKTKDATIKPTDLTKVFAGDSNNVAWVTDIRLDSHDRPYIAFSIQKNDADKKNDPKAGGEDFRFFYARWDGTKWLVREIAYAGSRLFPPEVDYAGLVALHPYDPDTLYISTNADPTTGKSLISSADQKRHHEIFKGHTADGGATWTWSAITKDSPADNLRPIVPPGDPTKTMVLWLRGTYTTFKDYNQQAIGVIEARQ